MSLPQLPNFEALLASFVSDKPADGEGWREFVAVPEELHVTPEGALLDLPAISFWYCVEGNLTVEALQKRVASELAYHGHASSAQIAAEVLGMFAFAKKSSASRVQQFNDGLKVVNADLNQFFI